MHSVVVWLLVAAFTGAGVFNGMATSVTRSNFVRWGYPAWWWCRIAGGLEILTATLIALPTFRTAGLILGALIIAVAALTVLRHREFSHLAPLGVFAAMLLTAGLTS